VLSALEARASDGCCRGDRAYGVPSDPGAGSCAAGRLAVVRLLLLGLAAFCAVVVALHAMFGVFRRTRAKSRRPTLAGRHEP
jgi:hypothetical protein